MLTFITCVVIGISLFVLGFILVCTADALDYRGKTKAANYIGGPGLVLVYVSQFPIILAGFSGTIIFIKHIWETC